LAGWGEKGWKKKQAGLVFCHVETQQAMVQW